ncbi:MAG: SpoIID/LytB domain-containing protein [Peptoniphilus sp.]|nr:SpoIID/LytB domain-containing protein [Peptoniphilus sp.]MDY3119196.1 SpoIID/LytB domain-containing protein [Peptoniphilus sp.]
MKKYLSLLLVALFFFFHLPVYASLGPIHVKVGSTASTIPLSSDGGLLQNGNPIGNSFLATVQNVSEDDIFSSTQGYVRIGGKPYRGSVRFIKAGGQLHSVNIVDVEDYIRGVLPKEIGTSTPIEALKAQAVISRSFAYANWNKFQKYGYNLDDSTASQVYAGMSVESAMTDRAVYETKGQVLYYQGNVANTIFHATSGGETEAIEDVWGGNPLPYLKAIKDPYSLNTRNATWTATLSASEISKAFPSVGRPTFLQVLARSSTGRITSMAVVGTTGREMVTGNQFRMKLGSIKIKSTNFGTELPGESIAKPTMVMTANGVKPYANQNRITASGIKEASSIAILRGNGKRDRKEPSVYDKEIMTIADTITLNGRGYGHGVGLSQYGAIEMAKSGMDYRAILAFYYPGTDLK